MLEMSEARRERGREETRVGAMIHPEVGVINSQSLCGPRVGRQEEMHAGSSMQASAFLYHIFFWSKEMGDVFTLKVY